MPVSHKAGVSGLQNLMGLVVGLSLSYARFCLDQGFSAFTGSQADLFKKLIIVMDTHMNGVTALLYTHSRIL